MTLAEWIIERQRRGISSSGDSGFHHAIKEYTPEDYDDLLLMLIEAPKGHRQLGKAVAWLLCQRPHRRIGMWIAYGGYAKERLVESLAGQKISKPEPENYFHLG